MKTKSIVQNGLLCRVMLTNSMDLCTVHHEMIHRYTISVSKLSQSDGEHTHTSHHTSCKHTFAPIKLLSHHKRLH